MDSICISLGGSIVSESKGVNVPYVRKFAEALIGSGKRFIVITGGGFTSRQYVTALREVHGNEFNLDRIGIKATELNALLVKFVFDSVKEGVAETCSTMHDIKKELERHNVVISHGQLPGVTTDAIAVLACESAGSNVLVNISDVPYIYDRPPEEEGARKLESMTHNELIDLASRYDTRSARSNFIFDLAACKFAKRSNVELRFIDTDLENLKGAISGKDYKGTTVK